MGERAETRQDGTVEEFKESSSEAMGKTQAISKILGVIPDAIMSHEQKHQLKNLIVDSTSIGFDASSGTFRASRTEETQLGPIRLGRDVSFKLGSTIPPSLTEVQGVSVNTGLGQGQLKQLRLGIDDNGNPVLKPEVNIYGMTRRPSIPLTELLGFGRR